MLTVCYNPVQCFLPPLLHDCEVLDMFPTAARLADVSLSTPVSFPLPSSPPLCVCVCCVWKGVCDSGPVKSDVWDAKGGVVPYLPASPVPAVRSSGPRLLLLLLSSWLLPLSLCGGVCCPPLLFSSCQITFGYIRAIVQISLACDPKQFLVYLFYLYKFPLILRK